MLRKRKAKKGAKSAIVYMARKLASIYYKMVTEKVEYDESQIVKNRKAYLENKLKYLTLISEKIKLQLTENQVLAPVVI
jgi:transposase